VVGVAEEVRRHPARVGVAGDVEREREEHVGAGAVGEGGALGLLAGGGPAWGGQEGLHPGGDEPPLHPLGQVVQDRVRGLGVLLGKAVAAPHVDHDDLAAQVGARLADPLLPAQGVGGAALDHRGEPGQRLERRRSAGAVRGDPEVALELPDTRLGLRSEVPVDAPHPEAQVEQTTLQRVDVVPGDQVAGEVGEDPVTESPPGLVEATEGERAHHTVHGQPTLLLEGAYGELDPPVVDVATRRGLRRGLRGPGVTGRRTLVEQTDPFQEAGDLGDGGTCVTEPEDRVHAATVAVSAQAM
jgi:hypothetical protein